MVRAKNDQIKVIVISLQLYVWYMIWITFYGNSTGRKLIRLKRD